MKKSLITRLALEGAVAQVEKLEKVVARLKSRNTTLSDTNKLFQQSLSAEIKENETLRVKNHSLENRPQPAAAEKELAAVVHRYFTKQVTPAQLEASLVKALDRANKYVEFRRTVEKELNELSHLPGVSFLIERLGFGVVEEGQEVKNG